MTAGNDDHSKKRKALLAWYNMIPNLIWSILNLTPIVIFCVTLIELKLVYIFLAISVVPLFLKKSFINRLQIGKTTKMYKKLGVHLINKVSQNGDIINNLLKRKFPEHRIVTYDNRSISGLLNQTYLFEKFHLLFFLFFSLLTGYSLYYGYWFWALLILVTNAAYNIYPIFLQQYIRLKLTLFRKVSKISND
jgi:Glycosyl-4,4'-diaponeurosporenoate acyltransferase